MAALRRLAERLSRGRVLRRHLPAEFGSLPLFVSPDSALAFWRPGPGSVDPRLLDWVREFVRPSMNVWDIGANNGVFAFAAAARAGIEGLVVAVEADPFLAGLLRRSSLGAKGRRAPVVVVNAAASDQPGVAEFAIAMRGRASSHLASVEGSSQAGGIRDVVHVPTVTMDLLLESFGRPDLIKIDVERAEDAVLRGACRTLAGARPVLLCEVGPNAAGHVSAAFKDAGYLLYDAALPARERCVLQRPVWDTLAIPAERAPHVPGSGHGDGEVSRA